MKGEDGRGGHRFLLKGGICEHFKRPARQASQECED